jgi:hypothetical protein
MPSTESADRFIRQLADLAHRLASRDIVVASLHCDWGSFGSWSMQAQKGTSADAYAEALLAKRWKTNGPSVARATWYGREKILQIETAPTPPLTSPGPWKREMERAFDDSEGAIRFVEEYLWRWSDSNAPR